MHLKPTLKKCCYTLSFSFFLIFPVRGLLRSLSWKYFFFKLLLIDSLLFISFIKKFSLSEISRKRSVPSTAERPYSYEQCQSHVRAQPLTVEVVVPLKFRIDILVTKISFPEIPIYIHFFEYSSQYL